MVKTKNITFAFVFSLTSMWQVSCSDFESLIEGRWVLKHVEQFGKLYSSYFSINTVNFKRNGDFLPPSEFGKPRINGKWELKNDDGKVKIWLNSPGSILNGIYEVEYWNDSLENGIILFNAHFSSDDLSFLLQRQNRILHNKVGSD